MSVEFGTTTITDWTQRSATLEWAVRWPDGSIHPEPGFDSAHLTVQKHRANGVNSTKVVFSEVRVIVGQWQDADSVTWLAGGRREPRVHNYVVGGLPHDPTPEQLALIESGEWRVWQPDGTSKTLRELQAEHAPGGDIR